MARGGVLRHLSHPALAAAGVRVLTLPVSIVCGLIGTRLTISSLGPTLFGVVSLILTLQLIFAFLDLGTGAAVLNEAARFRVHGDQGRLQRTWRASRNIATRASLTLLVLTGVLAVAGALPVILGLSSVNDVSVAVVTVVALNVVSRPATLALAVLQGCGHSVTVVLLQTSIPVTTFLVVLVAAISNAPLVFFAASLTCGQLACGMAALLMVWRRYQLPPFSFRNAVPVGPKPQLRNQAGPTLVINLVAPLGVGLDRVALAHLATPVALATYALVAQLLQPVYSLSATLTQSLWGDFSRKRQERRLDWEAVRSPLLLVLSGAGTCFIGFTLLTPWVAHLLAGDAIPVGHGLGALAGGFAFFVLALTVPGALLTTPVGLSMQAKVLVTTVILNLVLTWALAAAWGAAGALVGSVVGTGLQCAILARLCRRFLGRPYEEELQP